MGEGLSKAVQPEDLAVFKKLPANHNLLENIQIPEKPENRRPTDRKFLIVFIVIVLLLFPFLIYTLVNSDWDRIRGYDQCGNVCGENNTKYKEWPCTGKDETHNVYLQIDTTDDTKTFQDLLFYPRKCVRRCDFDYHLSFGKCFKDKSDSSRYPRDVDGVSEKVGSKSVSEYLNKVAWRIVLACALSLAVGIGMLVLFKVATAAVVWGMIGGVLIFGGIVTGLMWYGYFTADKWNQKDPNSKKMLLFFAIFLTVVLLILFCITVFMFRKIQLIIQLFKETTKATFAMPALIFVPVLTFLVELIILVLLIITTSLIYTSGILTEIAPEYLAYKSNVVMQITLILNIIVAFWATQFVIGVQYMIIAGAIAKWYWAKNKNFLDSPIGTSAKVAFKFHLGSVAFGSLIITIIAIIRSILQSLTKNKAVKAVVDACIGALESFLKFLSKNAYILIAMHGKPFYKSGKRAAKIIFQNAVSIVSINYVGDFILGMAHLLVILISMMITVGIMTGADTEYSFIVYLIVFLVSLFVAMTCFSTFETAIDTIFLCFCEDSLLNDGMARPYAMSRDLMEFVENSKKLYGEKKE
ncbi:choline transporter-like protein 1 [Diorhabda carinulata]|uniref:choline transporter-like protein 1 n=1 Tax=Diorhabda carinulata TaxID=1163345 RepID=UPI0025A0151B|nr:choline transporter-like protein 1 [Diorhabda carinulata]